MPADRRAAEGDDGGARGHRPAAVRRTTDDGETDRLIAFGDARMMDLVGVGYLPAVTALSTLTCRFVELPGQAMANGLLVRSRKAAPASPVAEAA